MSGAQTHRCARVVRFAEATVGQRTQEGNWGEGQPSHGSALWLSARQEKNDDERYHTGSGKRLVVVLVELHALGPGRDWQVVNALWTSAKQLNEMKRIQHNTPHL